MILDVLDNLPSAFYALEQATVHWSEVYHGPMTCGPSTFRPLNSVKRR